MTKPILIALSAVLLSFNFNDTDIITGLKYDHKEKFDPALLYLNSISKLELHIDSLAKKNSVNPGSFEFVSLVTDVIKYRFYHGFSHYTLSENWIATFSEKVMGYGLDSKVKPDDIMKNEYGACSQQSMVMMEILKRNNISYRSVGFPHHYALEVSIDGKWYFFDPNMEPEMKKEDRLEENWKCCADNLKRYYDTTRFKDLDWKFGKNLKVTTGTVNETPARHARLFQDVTAVFSRFMWCLPLLVVVYQSRSSFKAQLKKLWLFLTNNQKQKNWNPPFRANSLTQAPPSLPS